MNKKENLVNLDLLREDILEKLTDVESGFKLDFAKSKDQTFINSINNTIKAAIKDAKISLSRIQEEELLNSVVAYCLEFGPIGMFLKDPKVSEIMINGPKQVFVEREGKLGLTDVVFNDESHLAYFIERILDYSGRRVNAFEPCVDARLRDGSRINVVKPPVSTIGSILTIRKLSYKFLGLDDLVRLGTLSSVAADFLKAAVISRLNILICGGAGSGKTTLLNAIAANIPENERIISIEDTRELRFERKHFLPLETRPANIEGKGEISMRMLVKNALHMRPDRIIVGEVRSEELWDMLQAMNTGHDGSMTTLHANSAHDALERLEMLALLGNPNVSSDVARRQIISAIDLIIYVSRFSDGARRVMQVCEVGKDKEYALDDIFISQYNESGAHELKTTGNALKSYQRIKTISGYTSSEFEAGK